ncbi:hypothetical protein DN403_06395 [Bacillus sp. AY2-1]|nr:hypothetical protein DN403_06395 [Bacillus sp. AY2-1]
MLNEYSNITFPKVNYRVFSKKRHSCSVFFIVLFKKLHLLTSLWLRLFIYFNMILIHLVYAIDNDS